MSWDYQVSVIMPVYNGEAFVADAIDSVRSQTLDSWELVVINDGSTDGSADVIEPYLDDDRIRYLEQENQGVTATTNRGIREASGEYLTIHPQDDFSEPDRLERQVAVLEEHPDVGLVYTPAMFIDFEGNELGTWGSWKGEGRVSGSELFYKLYVDGNFLASPSVVFRRDHIRDEQHPWGDPELQIVSDWEHWLDAAQEYDAYELSEPLLKMQRDEDHDHLGGRRETVLAEEKVVLERARDRYADSPYPVTARHYARAMSNHYLRELRYRLQEERDYRTTTELALKTWRHNPFNKGLYYEFARRLPLFPG
jgi:glycosyltransferase involved in cell wall biosynthesis